MTEEYLELSALEPERPKANLRTSANPDGTVYELALPTDFSAVELVRMSRMVDELDALWESPKKLNKPQEARLEKLLNLIAAQLVIGAPDEEIAALPAITKRGLGLSFFVSAGAAQTIAMAPILEASSTSESS